MANPNKKQSTEWESSLVSLGQGLGFEADRYPLRGQAGEPDLYWRSGPGTGRAVPVLAWKRLVGVKREGRRKPLGVRDVIVLTPEDFAYLAERAAINGYYLFQAKAAQQISVTKVLGGLIAWCKKHRPS